MHAPPLRSPAVPTPSLAETVEALRTKGQELRALAVAATDAGWRRFYEAGAIAYDQWASEMQLLAQTAQKVENTAQAINDLVADQTRRR